MKKTLLLTQNYELVSILEERKAIKLYVNDKVEVISEWEDSIKIGFCKINFPSVIRLKHPIPVNRGLTSFSRQAVINRDNFCCQYCGKKLSYNQVTIDHIVPKCLGGRNEFKNCVVACKGCNGWKGNNSPEKAGMRLLRKPTTPNPMAFVKSRMENINDTDWHPDWEFYLK